MKKLILIISFLSVVIACIAVLYFSNLEVATKNTDKVLAFIPADAAVVAGFRNDHFLYEVFRDYPFFNAVLGKNRVKELADLLNLVKHPAINEATEGQNAFLSFHPDQSDSIQVLVVLAFGKKRDIEKIKGALNQLKEFKLKTIRINNQDIYELTRNTTKKAFYLYLDANVAAGSYSRELLMISISKQVAKIDREFISEITEGSKHDENSPVNLFIRHQELSTYLASFLAHKHATVPFLLDGLSGHSTLNLSYKSDALLFSGISKADGSSGSFINLFLGQKAVPLSLMNIFPTYTSNYISFGISDYSQFNANLRQLFTQRGEFKRLSAQFELVKNKSGFDMEHFIKPLIGNEFALVQLAGMEKIGVVKVLNGSLLKANLTEISTVLSDSISQFKHSNIPYYFFGDPFKSFVRPYFTIIDNYLVLANSNELLERFLSAYLKGNTLGNTPEFNSFNQFMANQSTVSLFMHNRNSGYMLRSALRQPYSAIVKDENYGFSDLYGWSLQLSGGGDHFFTNLYTGFGHETGEE